MTFLFRFLPSIASHTHHTLAQEHCEGFDTWNRRIIFFYDFVLLIDLCMLDNLCVCMLWMILNTKSHVFHRHSCESSIFTFNNFCIHHLLAHIYFLFFFLSQIVMIWHCIQLYESWTIVLSHDCAYSLS